MQGEDAVFVVAEIPSTDHDEIPPVFDQHAVFGEVLNLEAPKPEAPDRRRGRQRRDMNARVSGESRAVQHGSRARLDGQAVLVDDDVFTVRAGRDLDGVTGLA